MSRYLLRQFLGASSLVLLGLFLTWLAAEAGRQLELFGADPGAAWRLVLFRTLEMVPLGVPIACLTGAVWSLTRSAHYLELTAIRSGGLPLRRVLAPILATTVALGVGLALFEDRVLVPVRGALPDLTGGTDGIAEEELSFSNSRWWFAQESSLFAATSYDSDPLRLEGVTVFEFDEQRRIARRIDAQEARFVRDNTWEFLEARILTYEDGGPPEFRHEKRVALVLELSDRELSRALPSAETTSLHRLARWIRQGAATGPQLISLETALHSRLAQPFSLLVLVLFAVSLSVGDAERRDTLGRALLRSLIAATIYWTGWTSALLLAGSGQVPAALPLWGVTFLFLALGTLLYRAIPE